MNNPSALIGFCAQGGRPPIASAATAVPVSAGSRSTSGRSASSTRWTSGGRCAPGSTTATIRSGPQDVTFNILAPGVVKDQYSLGASYRIDKESEITGAAMYAANNSVTGPSLFIGFGAPPTTTETIAMKEYLVGIAYSRRF